MEKLSKCANSISYAENTLTYAYACTHEKKGILCQTHWVAITLTKVRKDVTVYKIQKKYKMPKRVFVHVWDYLVVVVVVH